jgi:hypothetical protein
MLGHAVAAEPSRHHHKRRPGEQQPRPPPAYIATAYLITGTKVLAYWCKSTRKSARKVREKCEKSTQQRRPENPTQGGTGPRRAAGGRVCQSLPLLHGIRYFST